MNKMIPAGVWPTMITPFSQDNQVDYVALEKLVEWYIAKGVHGLFAVCMSSELFCLSLEERIKIARFVKDVSDERVPVIASGPNSKSFRSLVNEIELIANTGVDAVVLLTNQFATETEDDEVWKENMKKVLSLLPEHINLGLYECPYPYKRTLSPGLLSWAASTSRFSFLKDTSCSLENMKEKIEAVENTRLKIYNANSATILDSYKLGISGFSGVMANFHPELYVWLHANRESQPTKAEELANFLGVTSLIERQLYPVNAKYHLQLSGLPIALDSRSSRKEDFSPSLRKEVEQLFSLGVNKANELGINDTFNN